MEHIASFGKMFVTLHQHGDKSMTKETSQFGLSSIGQISVNVHDLKKAVAFYRDTLGMKYLFEAGDLAFFDCGGIRLMLALPDKPEFDHPSSIIYYRVPDIQRSYELLMSRGVNFEEKPVLIARLQDHDLWLASFRDVDNNLLALMSEVPRV
jgi:catechol 2,3-dioxygenase-like lactoylglutathione lyase family enzyme